MDNHPLLRTVVVASVSCAMAVAAAAPKQHYVARRLPVRGIPHEMGADRTGQPIRRGSQPIRMASVNSWHLQATLPGAIIHDISLASPMTGYAAAELGQVWKTSDGGAHWAEVMNLGSPH